MTRVNLLFIGFLLSAGSLARADDASKAAKIDEFLRAAKFDQSLQQTLNMASGQIKSAAFQKIYQPKFSPEQQKVADEFQGKVSQSSDPGSFLGRS